MISKQLFPLLLAATLQSFARAAPLECPEKKGTVDCLANGVQPVCEGRAAWCYGASVFSGPSGFCVECNGKWVPYRHFTTAETLYWMLNSKIPEGP